MQEFKPKFPHSVFQKLGLTLAIFFTLTSLQGCIATAPKKDTPSDDGFVRRNYNPSQEQLQLLANLKLRYEQQGIGSVYSQMAKLIDSVPAAAEFMESKNVPVDVNYRTHLRERALKTLIQDGRFEPYLEKYWQAVIHQTAVPLWFSLDFAYSASLWHAEKNNSSREQKRLAQYSLRACPGHVVRNTRSLNGLSRNQSGLDGFLNNCEERPNDVLKWLDAYLKNENVSAHEKPELVMEIANYYFNQSNFGSAAGFYALFLQLHSLDQKSRMFDDLNTAFEMRKKMGIGEPVDNILAGVVSEKSTTRNKNLSEAVKRLRLIKDAGIKIIPPYGKG